jgi:hypothetical protein
MLYDAFRGCVVYGRVSGDSAAAHILQNSKAADRLGAIAGHLIETKVKVDPSSSKVTLEFSWDGQASPSISSSSASSSTEAPPAEAKKTEGSRTAPSSSSEEVKGEEIKDQKSAGEYSLDEVSKHNSEKDVWVVVNDQVRFLNAAFSS